ncbi:quinone oxidoreductase-like protein 1 isoform 5-T5 [Glossophaga mutica]
MKGLYFQQNSPNEEITFVFQERENLPVTEKNYVKLQVKACALSRINAKLLAEMKMEKELFPVGREVAGIVLDVGSKVSFFQPDDEVVGILPLDSEDPGLCEVVRVHEHYLVHKPEKVSWAEAAGAVRDGVQAYTALHYLSPLSAGKAVLIMDGASTLGTIAIQLALHRGAKVISTASSLEDKQHLERLRPPIARVVDVSHGNARVAESCLEETGGLGVDIVLDAGGFPHGAQPFTSQPGSSSVSFAVDGPLLDSGLRRSLLENTQISVRSAPPLSPGSLADIRVTPELYTRRERHLPSGTVSQACRGRLSALLWSSPSTLGVTGDGSGPCPSHRFLFNQCFGI